MADIKFFNVNQADYKHILASESNDGLMSAELYSKVKSLNDGKIPDIISDYARVEAKIDNVSTKLVKEYVTKTVADNTYQPKGNYLTSHQSLTNYVTNTSVANNYVRNNTSNNHTHRNYLTAHQSLAEYITNASVVGNYVNKNSSNNHTHSEYTTTAEFIRHDHTWTQISGRPSQFPPEAHTHSEYVTNTSVANTYASKTSLSNYVTNTSVFTNYVNKNSSNNHTHSNYLTSHQSLSNYVTKNSSNNHTHSNYLTSHQSLSGYLTTTTANNTYLKLAGGTMTGAINMGSKHKIFDTYEQLWLTSSNNVTLETTHNGTDSQGTVAWNNWGISLRAAESNVMISSKYRTAILCDGTSIDLYPNTLNINKVPVNIYNNLTVANSSSSTTYIYFNTSKTAYLYFDGSKFVFSHPVYHASKLLGQNIEDYVSVVITYAHYNTTYSTNNTNIQYTIFLSAESSESLNLSDITVNVYNKSNTNVGTYQQMLLSNAKPIAPGESKSFGALFTSTNPYYATVTINNNSNMISDREYITADDIPPVTPATTITYSNNSKGITYYQLDPICIEWHINIVSTKTVTINNVTVTAYDSAKNVLYSGLTSIGQTVYANTTTELSGVTNLPSSLAIQFVTFTINNEKSNYFTLKITSDIYK